MSLLESGRKALGVPALSTRRVPVIKPKTLYYAVKENRQQWPPLHAMKPIH